MASAVAPPATAKTATSTPSLYQTAVAQAKAALAAAQQPIQDEQAQSDAAFKQRQTDATGEAASLAELLKGIGPTVQGAYSTAAQNQGLLANGFSDGMKDKLQGNTDSLNAMLAKLGSPTQLDSHAQQAGDVLYGLGGYNPGSTFNREGAAFGAAADMLPGAALLKGQENVKSLQGQAITADQGFQNKLAEMAGQLPGQIQDNYSKLQTLALDDAKFREQIHNDNINAAYKTAELRLNQAKYSTDVQFKNATLQLRGQGLQLQAQRLQVEAQRVANAQYNQDRNYQIRLADLGIAQKRLQLSIVSKSLLAANGGLSPKDVTKYTSIAQSVAMQGYNGYTTYTTVNGVKTPQQIGRVSYFEAMQQALKKGIPVQIALAALDRVYPVQYRPTPAALAKQLGPLDPLALRQIKLQSAAMAAVGPAVNAVTNPVGALTSNRRLTGTQLSTLASTAIRMAAPEYATTANIRALVGRIMQESGGNPRAINKWDSNAKAGHPSKGILQTIDSTFNAYKLPGHGDIWNPLDNAIAAVRYMISRYGRIVGPSGSGY